MVNYTDAEFHNCLGEIDSEYELKITFGLMQSAALVNKMVSIGAFQEAVLIVAENLVQIAALVPEVSLVSDLMPIEQFKILTSAKSFRASLIQMVGSMCDSFRQADESMSRVKLNLIEIPSVLRSTIKLLSSDEREARAFMLNNYLKKLNIAAEVCETEAKTVVTKFRRTIEMLQELHRGCLTCESNSKMEKVKKEQMKIAYEGEAAAEREYADQIKKYEQEMRERKQVKKMGNFTELSEMIEYLEKGMVLLTEAKKEIKNSSFFYSFRYMASKIREIAEIIKRMTEIADKQTATGRKLLADQVIASVAHVTAIATVMHVCAETYTETSSRWIMPTITAVGKNLHLSKEETIAKLSQTKSKASGQLGDVTKFLTARMEQAMDQSKKRTLDFIKELD